MQELITALVGRWDELSPATATRLARRGRLVVTAAPARGRPVALGAVPLAGNPAGTELDGAVDLESALTVLASPPAVVDLLGTTIKGADLARWLLPDIAAAALEVDLADRRTLTAASRVLTGIIGDRWPGHTIEVRVPPSAAVQCGIPGEGPQHTRGTPPNVVETDPGTFVGLGVGTLSWAEARASHRVRASGTRSDLSWMFPLL